MKIYAINFEFDNGEEYDDLHNCGDEVLGYYASLDLAKDAFNKIDPQEMLTSHTAWMSSEDIDDYKIAEEEECEDIKAWEVDEFNTPYIYYVMADDSNDAFFGYYISVIDVIENLEA